MGEDKVIEEGFFLPLLFYVQTVKAHNLTRRESLKSTSEIERERGRRYSRDKLEDNLSLVACFKLLQKIILIFGFRGSHF